MFKVRTKQEIVPPVPPTLRRLNNQVESHTKVVSELESYLKQLKNMKASSKPKCRSSNGLSTSFHQSAKKVAKEDSQLADRSVE